MSDVPSTQEAFRRALADPLSFPLEFKTWLVGYLEQNTVLGSTSRLISNGAVPTGTMLEFAGATAPAGYLACDGTAVSRTTYAGLFSAIGVLWGVGDGSTTFNLPDFRGRVPVGYAASGGHADVSTLGANDGVAVANRRAKHRHTHSLSISGGSHGHDITTEAGGTPSGSWHVARNDNPLGINISGAGVVATHTHPTGEFSGTIGNSASDAADAPAYLVVNRIIKT